MNIRTVLFLAGAPLLLAGCGDATNQPEPGASPGAEASPASDASWVLASMPGDAKGVSELKSSASEGETVVLRGRIGGNKTPMNAASPVFTLVDSGIPTCADNPEDNCRTPWDYCCEPREVLTANSATVQLVDASGQPLAVDATGTLSPMDEVVVVGTVAPRPNSDVLIVKATGVYRVDG